MSFSRASRLTLPSCHLMFVALPTWYASTSLAAVRRGTSCAACALACPLCLRVAAARHAAQLHVSFASRERTRGAAAATSHRAKPSGLPPAAACALNVRPPSSPANPPAAAAPGKAPSAPA